MAMDRYRKRMLRVLYSLILKVCLIVMYPMARVSSP